jgi:signal transduction histidine kinase
MAKALYIQEQEKHLAMLGHLASVLSHEIRNPLAAVFLHVDILEEELRQPAADTHVRMTESVAEIKSELARISDLVENYLALARLTNQHGEPTELGALVEAFILEVRERLAQRGICPHLEGLTKLGQVALHQNTFRRVLINLVQNAMDAMPQGGMLILRGQCVDSQARLLVQDTGSGIPPDQLPLLFTPFHTTKPEGTGLGLYVVQQVIAACGGTVTISSTPGKGTTCIVTLPLVGA